MATLGEVARVTQVKRPAITMPRKNLRKVTAMRCGSEYKIKISSQALDQYTDGYLLNGHLYEDGLSICAMNHQHEFKVRFYRRGFECGFFVPAYIAAALGWDGLHVLTLGVMDDHFLLANHVCDQKPALTVTETKREKKNVAVFGRKNDDGSTMTAEVRTPAADGISVEPAAVAEQSGITTTGSEHSLEYAGVKKPLTEWAKELGLSASTLYHRVFRAKIPVEEALTRPVRKYSPRGTKAAAQAPAAAITTNVEVSEGDTSMANTQTASAAATGKNDTHSAFRTEFNKKYRASFNVEPIVDDSARLDSHQQKRPADMAGRKTSLGAEVIRLVARVVGNCIAVWEVRCGSCGELNAVSGSSLRSKVGVCCKHCRKHLKASNEILYPVGQEVSVAPAAPAAVKEVAAPAQPSKAIAVAPVLSKKALKAFREQFAAKYNTTLNVQPVKPTGAAQGRKMSEPIDMNGWHSAVTGSRVQGVVAQYVGSGDRVWEVVCGKCGKENAMVGAQLRGKTKICCRFCGESVKGQDEMLVATGVAAVAKKAAQPAQQEGKAKAPVASKPAIAKEAPKAASPAPAGDDETVVTWSGWKKSFSATYFKRISDDQVQETSIGGDDADALVAQINSDPDLVFGAGYGIRVFEVMIREVKVKPQIKLAL